MKKIVTKLVAALLLLPLSTFAQIYVSPTGTDANPGTLASPKSLENAIATVQAGQTIYMRGGTYSKSATIIIADTNNGTATGNKRIEAYAGEIPVIDFASQALADGNRGFVLDGDYWYFKGLTIQNAGDNGMLLSGNNNTIDNCIFKKNRDTGLQLSRYKTANATISTWPSNNLILNCESFDNKDAASENADGFAAKLTSGTGNIFRGCISHNNSDDGWDLYTKTDTGPIGIILFENCIAYNNGTLTDGTTTANGDKNGFKLGGSGINVNHIVRRCVAFGNGHHGFTDNNNLGSIEMSNNTSFNNKDSNFSFREGGTHQFRNNLSYNGTSSDKKTGTDVSNSNVWWVNGVSTSGSSLVVSSADFVSLTLPANIRSADGSPSLSDLASLTSTSDMIDKGITATGITYNGTAPDLGARESGSTTTASYTLTVTASPTAGGTITKSPSATTYAAGTVVTLTATAATGYVFTGWSNGATTASTTVTMNANTTITANFVATYTLTTTVSPTAGGTITKSPSATTYAAGTVVTLTATAASGYAFTGWSNGATTASTTVTMNADTTITANFVATYTLTTTASPTAGGTIAASPSATVYNAGTVVTLTATAAAGYVFTGWSNGATSASTTVTMNANTSITANFAVQTSYTLTTTASPTAGGTITKSPSTTTYAAGTVVTLTATAAAGYAFTGWSNGATTASTTVTMNANTTITANFVATYTLTTTASPTAGGTIAASPSATAYNAGTVVTLTATAASGYSFTGWSNGATTTSTTVTMNANTSITANFAVTTSASTLRIDDSATTTSGYCGADGSRQNTYTNADGGYYVNLSNSTGNGVDYAVSVPAAGTYSVVFRYANAGSSSATSAKVLVNGASAIASLSFPKTTSWSTWTTTASATISLVKGTNKIRLETTASSEFANIDWIEITGNAPVAASCSNAVGAKMTTEESAKTVSFNTSVSPNPVVDGNINLHISTSQKTNVTIEMYDMFGQKVLASKQIVEEGQNEIRLDQKSIPSGLYFLNIESDNFKKGIKIVVK